MGEPPPNPASITLRDRPQTGVSSYLFFGYFPGGKGGCLLSKINWDKVKTYVRIKEIEKKTWFKRKVTKIKGSCPLLEEAFKRAIENTKNDVNKRDYAASWSIRKFFMTKGWITPKQKKYIYALANRSQNRGALAPEPPSVGASPTASTRRT